MAAGPVSERNQGKVYKNVFSITSEHDYYSLSVSQILIKLRHGVLLTFELFLRYECCGWVNTYVLRQRPNFYERTLQVWTLVVEFDARFVYSWFEDKLTTGIVKHKNLRRGIALKNV